MNIVKYDEGVYAFEEEDNESLLKGLTNRFDQMDHLLEMFGNPEKVLREVVDAMSDREFDDIFQHIARMWDLEV